jgi:hypothetical protein
MNKLRSMTVAAVAAGVALFGVPSVASAAPCSTPGNCSPDTDLIAVSDAGRWFQTHRNGGDGTWTPFASLEGQAGDPGHVVDTSTSVNYDLLYVAAVTDDGGLYWTIRRGRAWTPISDVKASAGDPGKIVDVSIADIQNTTHFLVRTENGGLFHAMQFEGGSWTQFSDVTAMTGSPGFVTDVAAVLINHKLHILVTNNEGRTYHSLRETTGAWTPMGDVKAMTGDPGHVARVSGTKANGELQILVSTNAGGLYHAIRHTNGSWTRLGDVKSVTGNPGAVKDVAAGTAFGMDGNGIGGQIQIAVAANGGLFHAIRFADGSWTRMGNVEQVSGDPGLVTRVAISG